MTRLVHLLLGVTLLCSLPQVLVAQKTEKATPQKQKNGRCKNAQVDLTGTFTGLLFTDKNQKEGTPATLDIKGNHFELTSDTLKGAGLISGVNSCGDLSVALKFTRANDPQVLSTSVSMDARVVKGRVHQWKNEIGMIASVEPIILATTQDEGGNLAGPDIAFVICPKYPLCKRYKTCTCPEPASQ